MCVHRDFGNDVYTGASALLPHAGKTGHTEVVRVVYEPEKINFAQLLKVFWESHNPTQGNISFCHKIISRDFWFSSGTCVMEIS